MKKLRILFTAVIITCFASLFCGCKEPDEQGLKDLVSTLVIEKSYSPNDILFVSSEKIESIAEHYESEILCEEEFDFCNVWTIPKDNLNYSAFYLGHTFPNTRKNITVEFLLQIQENSIVKNYKGYLNIDFINEGDSLYCSKEDFIFQNIYDSSDTINAKFIYGLTRSM